MENKADVLINFGDGEKALSVTCIISFEKHVTDFRFSLSTLLTIDRISANTDLEWNILKDWQPQWQHKSNEIEVLSKMPMRELTIEYHGNVSGWCNMIEERRIALSVYSAWTISETSIPIKFLFKMKDMEDYLVINARYDEAEKLWVYGETEHDTGNIIALKNGMYHVVHTGNFSYYYLSEAEKAYADSYASNYDGIIEYFTTVFGKKDINKLNVVSLDFKEGGGGYFRKELIVIDKMHISEDKNEIRQSAISFLGHELGHNWFAGADTATWEDWLNETGAEWAALLYILSLHDTQFFESQLSEAKETYKDTPVIKSPDSKRPAEGVHFRGVVMFYEIYRKYGADMILKMLQILANLKEVTTANFLSELRAGIDDTISELIERGLTVKDYTELFRE